MRVAIVGTRKILIDFENLVKAFQKVIPADAVVTSGNAPGTDQVSKRWEKNIQYLPWATYNSQEGLGCRAINAGDVAIYDAAIYKKWPYLVGCNPEVLRLIRRNCAIVLGIKNDHRVDAVYFYARESKSGIVEGGTKYAVEVARALGIPTTNLWSTK